MTLGRLVRGGRKIGVAHLRPEVRYG
jgi:hypothetical protein